MTKPRVFALLGTLASSSLLCNGASFAQWYNPFGDKDGDGCGSWDITCNPHVKPITKPIVEDLWGEAGQSAYKAASEIMYRTNGSAQALDYEQKRWLRPLHGSLVDRVSVIYNSRMMERWGIPGTGKDVVLNSPESEGQRYCNRIYIRASYQPGNVDQIYLLAHELEHSAQCERLGGMGKFGWHYFREYKRAGMSYENNKFESEARSRANMLQNPGIARQSNDRSDAPGNKTSSAFQLRNQWSGKCLQTMGQENSNGSNVNIWDCTNTTNQMWVRTANGELRNQWSGKCLQTMGQENSNGSNVNIWECTNTSNQDWR